MVSRTETGRRRALSRPGFIPGEPGLWVVIFVEMVEFGLFFGSVAYYAKYQPDMVHSSQEMLNQGIAAINTLLLLTGSLFVALGVQDVRAKRGSSAGRYFRWAIICAVGFGVFKAIEYTQKFAHGITPTTNFFFQQYFVFTGMHMLHVVVATGLLGFMVYYTKSPSKMDHKRRFIEGSACYWHMVDLIWIGLYAVIYLA